MAQQSTLSGVPMHFSQSSPVPKGWKVVENIAPRQGEIDLELVEILKPEESWISGEEMVRRARNELNANLGLEDLEIVLRNQHLLPTNYRSFYIPFPGTILEDPSGDRGVACLFFGGRRWFRYFFWLGSNFYGSVRLLRPR